jgi:lipopolysaccharide/colanic/teichoic acid biosynthesis glycosyltransferase
MKPIWLVALGKRALDLVGGIGGYLAFAFTFPFLSMLIKLESPGPSLYRQVRVGMNRRSRSRARAQAYAGPERRKADLGGRTFSIVKYRTMRLDAEANGPQLCLKGVDPRVTRLGKWLRALHIDEIPQFINVVKGDMSLVGPRPEMLFLVERYDTWQRQRLAVPPGITGWWQVNGRSDLPMHLNTQFDLYYIRNYSLWLDLKILWKTVWVVLKGQGAY